MQVLKTCRDQFCRENEVVSIVLIFSDVKMQVHRIIRLLSQHVLLFGLDEIEHFGFKGFPLSRHCRSRKCQSRLRLRKSQGARRGTVARKECWLLANLW